MAEHYRADQLRRHRPGPGKAEGWQALERSIQSAQACADPLLVGDGLLTASGWRRRDYASQANIYLAAVKEIFTTERVPGRIVKALEQSRLSYLPAQFNKLIQDELARWGPDAPPEVLGYLRYHHGRSLIAAGRPAEAVDDLRYALAEARSRDAEDPYQVYYFAVACHAAGLYREAADQLDRYLYWLDNLRTRGELAEPNLDQRGHALLAECRRALSQPAAVT